MSGARMKIGREKKKRSLRGWSCAFVLFLSIVGGVVLWSSPALACKHHPCSGENVTMVDWIAAETANTAKKIAAFGKSIAEYTKIAKLYQAMNDLYEKSFKDTQDRYDLGTMMRAEVQIQHIKTMALLSQKKIDAEYATELVAAESRMMAEAGAMGDDSTDDILCFTISSRQMQPVMLRFSQMVSTWALNGIVADRTGNGPAYVLKEKQALCGQLNENDPVTGNPADGLPPGCSATAQNGPVPFADAAKSSLTLEPGMAILKMPTLEDKTINTPDGGTVTQSSPKAKAGDTQQQMWIAAYDYCSHMAGPRPNPPSGKELETSEGKVNQVIYGKCMSAMTEAVKQCTDRIGYITRPNCEDTKFKEICDASKRACQAAAKYKITLPASFDNCEKGLSLFEVEMINHSLCASKVNQTSQKKYGSTSEQVMAEQSDCLLLQAAWESKKAQQTASFLRAMKDLQKVRACWRDMR